MSTTAANTLPPVPPATARPLTVAEFAALPSASSAGDLKHELDDGRVVDVPLPGNVHARVSSNVNFHFRLAERNSHGKAWDEVGVILRRNPDRVVGPDACFFANRSLPVKVSPEGFLETMPDIAVEVRSKNDTLAELDRKANEYLAAGVGLVWVLDPIRGNTIVYEPGQSPRTLVDTDSLPAGNAIPGFNVAVGEMLQV